jgi:hypothetical protein
MRWRLSLHAFALMFAIFGVSLAQCSRSAEIFRLLFIKARNIFRDSQKVNPYNKIKDWTIKWGASFQINGQPFMAEYR